MKLLVVLFACYSWDTYTQDVNVATCSYLERCDDLDALGYASADECVDEYVGWAQADGECPGFDKTAAKRCVKGWQELSCEALASDYPGDCDLVCPGVEDTAPADSEE